MARPRKREFLNVGVKFEAALVVGFSNLARDQGVSMREALRRVMTQAVVSGTIPGISRLDMESREREKWGESATPVYDGEKASKRPQDAQKASEPLS